MSAQLGGAMITGFAVIATTWIASLRNAEQAQRRVGVGALAAGLLTGLPVGGVMLILTQATPATLGPLQASLYGGFVSSALPAELGKLVVLALYVQHIGRRQPGRREFGPMAGIRVGSAVSLGVAAVECAFYLAVEGGWATAVLRAVPGVLVQAAAGGMVGYALAMRHAGSADRRSVWSAWVQALLLHGAYGFAILAMVEISYLQIVADSDLTPWVASLFALSIAIAAVAVGRLRRLLRVAHSR